MACMRCHQASQACSFTERQAKGRAESEPTKRKILADGDLTEEGSSRSSRMKPRSVDQVGDQDDGGSVRPAKRTRLGMSGGSGVRMTERLTDDEEAEADAVAKELASSYAELAIAQGRALRAQLAVNRLLRQSGAGDVFPIK